MAVEDDDKDLGDANVDTMGLSPEEIAAMDDDDDDLDDLKDIADDDEDDEDDAPAAKPAKQESKADAKDAPATDVDDTSDDEEKPSFIPFQKVDKVENYDQRMAEIDTQLEELDKQLEDGDIDLKAYTTGVRDLSNQQLDLKMTQKSAVDKESQNEFVKAQLWQSQQEDFFEQTANKVYGENSMLLGAFNSKIKELALLPENANKSGTWFLKETDKEVRKLFNLGEQAREVKDTKQNRKPDLKGIPKTLGALPAADNTATSDNEFAHLDNLDGMELESALARMPEDKVNRYLTT